MSTSYYATIPSWVLSHPTLTPAEKLMCALLSSMSQKNGYCYATNEAFSEALATSDASVKYILSKLDKAGVIAIHNKKTKKAGNRQIRLLFAERIEGSIEDPEEQPQNPRDEAEDAFDRFYEIYPRKEKRVPALKMFKTKKLHKRIEALIRATKNYASKMADTDKQFIMLPVTFLNNQIWEEYIAGEEAKKISNGAAEPEDQFARFVKRLQTISREAFNSAAGLDGAYEYEHDFSEKERSFIENVGGFRALLVRVMDGDFMVEFKPYWERSE